MSFGGLLLSGFIGGHNFLMLLSGDCYFWGVVTGCRYRVSLEVSFGVCRGQGSQIQDRAVVTQGVIEAVI